MNTDTYESYHTLLLNNRYNSMNGNTINDIYIDSEQRIWMANYPIGITVRNKPICRLSMDKTLYRQ